MGFPIGMLQNKSNAHLDSWALQSGKWQVRTASQTGPTRNIKTTPEATTKEIGTDGLGHIVFFKVAWSVTQVHCATLAATSCPWTRGASRQKMTTPYLVPSSMAKRAFRWFGCLGFRQKARGRRCGETVEDVWVHRLGLCSRLPWRPFGPQAELESLCSNCLPQKSRAAYASQFLVTWCGHADRDIFFQFAVFKNTLCFLGACVRQFQRPSTDTNETVSSTTA